MARHNVLSFERAHGEDQVTVHLSPAYGDVEIYWEQRGQLRLHWRLYDIEGLTIEKDGVTECLRMKSKATHMAETLLFLRPVVKLVGGMKPND